MNYSEIFKSNTSIVAFIITLLWAVSDYSSRIIYDGESATENNGNKQIMALNSPTISEPLKQHINQLYARHEKDNPENEVEIKATEKNKGLSEEEQALQAGELKTVFAGDKKLQLRAVLMAENILDGQLIIDKKILLQVTSLDNSYNKIETYTNHDTIYGFKMSIINNTQVLLVKTLDKLGKQQTITLSMYANNKVR